MDRTGPTRRDPRSDQDERRNIRSYPEARGVPAHLQGAPSRVGDPLVQGGTNAPGTSGSLLVRPALELAELLRSGRVHAREPVDAALRGVEEREPHLNAFSFVDGERALARAGAISAKDPRPFAGVPIAIKDGTPQQGLPMRLGSALFENHVADHDAAVIRRLEEAGFVPIGRTTMPEFGILPTTEPRLSGPTRNPWDLSRTPGGSSGGSAAAVAAGVVPLAHGGDGGGSLRIPAACCGLVGLKPSRGRISFAPDRGDDPLVTEGVLTRTVADTAALLDILSGYEPGDANWTPPPTRPFGEAARAPPSGLRVGLMLHPPVPSGLDPVCARAAEDAARLLENLGHHVETFDMEPLTEVEWKAFEDVWAVLAAEGVAAGEGILGRPPTPVDVEPLTWALYEKGGALDALSYRRSLAVLQRTARRIVGAALAYDVLLTPALAQRPVPIGAITGMERPDPLNALSRSNRFTPYTALWNVTGQPAVSLPLFHGEDGLPLGVQLVGRQAKRHCSRSLPNSRRPTPGGRGFPRLLETDDPGRAARPGRPTSTLGTAHRAGLSRASSGGRRLIRSAGKLLFRADTGLAYNDGGTGPPKDGAIAIDYNAKAYRLLETIHDLSDGDPRSAVLSASVSAKTGIPNTHRDFSSPSKHLKDLGLIRTTGTTGLGIVGMFLITPTGIRVVESLRAAG